MSNVTKPIILNETGEQIVQKLSEIASSNKSFELLLDTKADKTSVSTPYNFKGSTTYDALPTSNNKVNDTYYCTDVKCKYTWNGSGWFQSSLSEVDYTDEISKLSNEIENSRKLINIMGKLTRGGFPHPNVNGEINTADIRYYYTDFIPIPHNNSATTIVISHLVFLCMYDANKNFIGELPSSANSTAQELSIPLNAKYIRLGALKVYKECGVFITDIETYNSYITNYNVEYLSNEVDSMKNSFSVQYLQDYATQENTFYNGDAQVASASGYRTYPNFILEVGKYYLQGDFAYKFCMTKGLTTETLNSFENLMFKENGLTVIELTERTRVYVTNIRNKKIYDETGEIVYFPPMICDNIPPTDYIEGYYLPPTTSKSNAETYSETTITVSNDGNGDFADIKSALDSITDNSIYKRYIVFIKNGIYNVPSGVNYLGLKNYVSIVGESKENVIVQNLYSDTVYDNSRNVFDAHYYTDAIEYASIKNMTIVVKGGKAPIHIDTDYSHFANGGLIEIDNCVLIDKNTLSMTNIPIRSGNYNAGGVNVGLRGGQAVKVTNVESNGLIYAHNTPSQSKPCLFEVEHCSFVATMWGDLGSTQEDKAIFKDCHLQQFYFNNGANVTTTKVKTELYNNEIETVTSVSNISDNWNNSFYEWNRLFGGKFTIIEQNIHQRVFNVSSETILAGSLVELVTMRGVNENGVHVRPYNEGYLYGYALENIPSGEHGLIQFKNTVEIPQINNISVGDEIECVNGTYQKKTTSKTVGYYMGSSTYNRYLMKLN